MQAYTCLRWSVHCWHMSHKEAASERLACLLLMDPSQQHKMSQARLAVVGGVALAVSLVAAGLGVVAAA